VSSDRGRAWARMLIVCGLVVVADQAAKGAIIETMAMGERTDLALGVDLARVTNSGIAFGLLDQGSDGVVLAVTIAALALVVGWFAYDPRRPGFWLGVGLLTGGALGNLADRIRAGAVTDFLDPPLWPAFNVADIAITAGVIVIALAALSHPEPAKATAGS
jgi:signal peptidase II